VKEFAVHEIEVRGSEESWVKRTVGGEVNAPAEMNCPGGFKGKKTGDEGKGGVGVVHAKRKVHS